MSKAPYRRSGASGILPGVASLAALLVLWAAAAALTGNPQRLPGPGLVLQRLTEIAVSGELWFHAGMTLFRVVAAFAVAMVLGGALGLWMGRSRLADRWLDPTLVIMLNIPALVVIVLCYIWIGLNETAAILAVALNKIPVVAVMLREGARALRPDLDDMAQVFAMSPLSRLRHVVLPQLAPHIAAAARSGIALIWKIVLVVEFLGRSNGVGFKIHLLFSSFDVARVLAWSLAFVAVMLAVDLLVLRPWEARAARWRQDEA
ncbi:MAG TPA: ABC transporter permease [Paracoccus sp. (in: a-proteobacteria)]|nr:ABC transporter permease [Paracoccus sp. (in: a-proteobacteria)]